MWYGHREATTTDAEGKSMRNQVKATLDVRQIEPKHRFEKIMGTWKSLDAGGTMELVVDHDPECMYYTIKAEQGDTFEFDYLERGPVTWRVLARKH